jgi:hypothetical protein
MSIKKTIRRILMESDYQETVYTSEDRIIKTFNRILNTLAKKKYDWLINFDITSIKDGKNTCAIAGTIKVDEDWFGNKWIDTYDSYNAPNPNERDISIGELQLGRLSYELEKDVKTALSYLLTKEITSFNGNQVYIRTENNEELIESEITEKCWRGYTQKGMKTMFGKRYPNCVKKTKK